MYPANERANTLSVCPDPREVVAIALVLDWCGARDWSQEDLGVLLPAAQDEGYVRQGAASIMMIYAPRSKPYHRLTDRTWRCSRNVLVPWRYLPGADQMAADRHAARAVWLLPAVRGLPTDRAIIRAQSAIDRLVVGPPWHQANGRRYRESRPLARVADQQQAAATTTAT